MNPLTFIEFLNVVLTTVTVILMISAKLVSPDHIEITVFWNKGYSNYTVDN